MAEQRRTGPWTWTGVMDPTVRASMARGLRPAALPLTDGQALDQAVYLVTQWGLTYTAVAAVMAEYHGVFATEDAWRHRCRNAGVPARPQGRGCGSRSPRLRGAA